METEARGGHFFYGEGFKFLNSQKYSECQLITAINAAIFLGEPSIKLNTVEHERLVDLVSARWGAAISIEKAHQYLRIYKTKMNISWDNIVKYNTSSISKRGNPFEATVFHEKTGRHSVLIVDYDQVKSTKYIQVVNFSQITDKNCWVRWSKFTKHLREANIPAGDRDGYFSLSEWHVKDMQEAYFRNLEKK